MYPLYYVVIASISDPNKIAVGAVTFLPKDITFEGYKSLKGYTNIWIGYKNSFIYAIGGSCMSTLVTLLAAYSCSKKNFPLAKPVTILVLVTMFFNGGLIPTYMVVKSLGIYDTMWAVLLVGSVHAWNFFIAKNYFQEKRLVELSDAAFIDGCTQTKYFFKILIPTCKPTVIVIFIFYAVWQWNDFFRSMIYLSDTALYPMQLILKRILSSAESAAAMSELIGNEFAEEMRIKAELLKYCIIVISILPITTLYMLFQKQLIEGITAGAVKG